ncbi:DUF4880 domain-containing protein [Dyella monticola]|uniref:DUF4880 domain-containing protein n=1 Tax=Dyella monticola TaxID=1927958 RepID=A0A370WUF1_9GAMM|nr:FecR domain-containing protein [Dyella monticola]RDS79742.1 DUF4880 domain-containing protein [Dyella monticola]
MSEATHFDAARQARRITEQAAAWYLEQQEPLTERQRVAFLEWLRASPQHVAEYFAIAQMHGDLKAAAALQTQSVAALTERARRDNPVVLFPHMENVLPRERGAHPPRRRRALAAWAATAVVLAAIGLGVVRLPGHSEKTVQATMHGAVGNDAAVHTMKLADGTLVQLDRNSVIDVHFDQHYRRINVVRGNVLFDIGKDPARPMLVNVGGHVLQDIGTVFDVKRDAQGDTLTVISGRVRVLKAPDPSVNAGDVVLAKDAVADLTAGQQIELNAAGASAVHAVKIARATAWLPADIRFQRETVSDVARRFNAYTSKPLLIQSASIGDKRISGIFHANNPQAFVAYLATLPGVTVINDTDCIRIVASAAQADTKAGHL